MKPPRYVKSIALVAQELGVDEDLLWDIQVGMSQYDGVIRIYDIDGRQSLGFTPWGIEHLQEELAQRLPSWQKPPRTAP